MKRSAFTLIELLISIILFGLITFFLFGVIDNLRNQQSFFHKKQAVMDKKNKIISLMQSDFSRAQSVSIFQSSNKDFDRASITGSNRSLYNINDPYVAWVILKNDNTLIRLESASPITIPISEEALYLAHSDLIAKHCEIFRIYDSPQNRLIFLKIENQSPLIVEVKK